jgi:spore germination protein KC
MLTGCWSKHELSDIAIATALGIDQADGRFRVSVQLLNPGEIASKVPTDRTPVFVHAVEADTIFEAMRKLTTLAPRKIYLSHIRLIILGEELAEKGIAKPLDYLSRDHEMRADFFIAIAKNHSAEELVSVLTPLEKIPANQVFTTLEMSEQTWAPTKGINLDELINSLVSDGKTPVLTGISLHGSAKTGASMENISVVRPKTEIQVTGLGVFKQDSLVGWMTEKESKGFNYITSNIGNTVGSFPCRNKKEDRITVEVIRSQAELIGKVKNGTPSLTVKITAEENIGEVQCDIDLTDPAIIRDLEKKAEEEVEEIAYASIKRAQEEFQSDIFGFGEVIHREDPKAWKTLKKDWEQHFSRMDIKVIADVHIRRVGAITESFQKKASE